MTNNINRIENSKVISSFLNDFIAANRLLINSNKDINITSDDKNIFKYIDFSKNISNIHSNGKLIIKGNSCITGNVDISGDLISKNNFFINGDFIINNNNLAFDSTIINNGFIYDKSNILGFNNNNLIDIGSLNAKNFITENLIILNGDINVNTIAIENSKLATANYIDNSINLSAQNYNIFKNNQNMLNIQNSTVISNNLFINNSINVNKLSILADFFIKGTLNITTNTSSLRADSVTLVDILINTDFNTDILNLKSDLHTNKLIVNSNLNCKTLFTNEIVIDNDLIGKKKLIINSLKCDNNLYLQSNTNIIGNLQLGSDLYINNQKIIKESSLDRLVINGDNLNKIYSTQSLNSHFKTTNILGDLVIDGNIISGISNKYNIGGSNNIKELFLSNDSIWLGEKQKFGISNTGYLKKMELKKKYDYIPSGITEISSSINSDIIREIGPVDKSLSDYTLSDWEKISEKLGDKKDIGQIFKNDIDYNDDNYSISKSVSKGEKELLVNIPEKFGNNHTYKYDEYNQNIYFTDSIKNILGKIDKKNNITGIAKITGASGLDLYPPINPTVALVTSNTDGWVRKVDLDVDKITNMITTIKNFGKSIPKVLHNETYAGSTHSFSSNSFTGILGFRIDKNNNFMYIADSANHRIQIRVPPNFKTEAEIRVINVGASTYDRKKAYFKDGNGLSGGNPDLYPKFNVPADLVIDNPNINDQYIYVADRFNNCIRKITVKFSAANWKIFDQIDVTTLAGANTTGNTIVAYESGAFANSDHQGKGARFNLPMGLAIDKIQKIIYVADSESHCIRKIDLNKEFKSGFVTTLAGADTTGDTIVAYASGAFADSDDQGKGARFNNPMSIAIDKNNYNIIYVVDHSNHCIRKIDIDKMGKSGFVTTLAGTNIAGFKNANGTSARFRNPLRLTVDNNNIYVTDMGNDCVRKIDISTRFVSTLARANTDGNTYSSESLDNLNNNNQWESFYNPRGIEIDENVSNTIYVSDDNKNGTSFIRKIITDNIIIPLKLNDIVINSDGNGAYVSLENDHTIRELTFSDTIDSNTSITTTSTTIAGQSGITGYTDSAGLESKFNGPTGLALYPTLSPKKLLVADSGNQSIRAIEILSETTPTHKVEKINSYPINNVNSITVDQNKIIISDKLNKSIKIANNILNIDNDINIITNPNNQNSGLFIKDNNVYINNNDLINNINYNKIEKIYTTDNPDIIKNTDIKNNTIKTESIDVKNISAEHIEINKQCVCNKTVICNQLKINSSIKNISNYRNKIYELIKSL